MVSRKSQDGRIGLTPKLTDPRRQRTLSASKPMNDQETSSAERGADSCAAPCSALVLDSEWTYNRTGETMRVLYWEKGVVFFRKVRGLDGLVGQTFRLDRERFLAAYTPNDPDQR